LFPALALFLALLAPPAAAAESITTRDAVAIRAVIQQQISAFKRDDAQEAFALASPGVRRSFRTADRFLDVVRMAYRAVYRPSQVVFLEMVVLGDDVVQAVQVVDHAGKIWVAYYGMQRQDDGSWRTNGCHLVRPARTIPA
jgi:hypothetical protein